MKSHLLLLSMVTTIAVAQTPSYPDAAASDPLFHFAARTDAGLGQHLLQPFRRRFGKRPAVAGYAAAIRATARIGCRLAPWRGGDRRPRAFRGARGPAGPRRASRRGLGSHRLRSDFGARAPRRPARRAGPAGPRFAA